MFLLLRLKGQNPANSDNTIFVDVVNIAAVTNAAPTVAVSVTPSTGLVAPEYMTVFCR